MAYDLVNEIQIKVNQVIPEGCHVHKTGSNIAVYALCKEKQVSQYEPLVDIVLAPYRQNYTVYFMTDEYSRRFNGK